MGPCSRRFPRPGRNLRRRHGEDKEYLCKIALARRRKETEQTWGGWTLPESPAKDYLRPTNQDGAAISMSEDHDPWNEPAHRHPRAQILMPKELWSCVNENAPFGSDEGATAYDEYRAWRAENPKAPLVDCIAWIGDESGYGDAFTFDATIIATVLGQLVDEGRIDAAAKPFAYKAIARQLQTADAEHADLLTKAKAAMMSA